MTTPRAPYSSARACSAFATSTWDAPVNLTSASIESDSDATKRSASSLCLSSPASTNSACIALRHQRRRDQLQFVVGRVLFVRHAALTNQLQDRQERCDDARAVEVVTERAKFDASALANGVQDEFHLPRDRELLAGDRALLRPRVSDGSEQCEGETLRRDAIALDELGRRVAGIAVEKRSRFVLARAQFLRDVLVFRIGDEPAAQPLFDLFGRLLAFGLKLGRDRGQERARFEKDKRRRDNKVF